MIAKAYTLRKIKYVIKAETSFKVHPNNYRPDLSGPNAISACYHLTQNSYQFNNHAKVTLKETITNRETYQESNPGHSVEMQKRLDQCARDMAPSLSKFQYFHKFHNYP